MDAGKRGADRIVLEALNFADGENSFALLAGCLGGQREGQRTYDESGEPGTDEVTHEACSFLGTLQSYRRMTGGGVLRL
jgi:hypothetical protein